MYGKLPTVEYYRISLIFSRNFTRGCFLSNRLKDILSQMSFKDTNISSKTTVDKKLNIFEDLYKLQVIGSGANGAPRSVLFSTGAYRYLFNCGEGTQRLSFEYKIKLSRLQNVFITYRSWENIAGLIGIALSLQQINVSEIFIHGPNKIETVFSGTNKFINLRKLKVIKKESHPEKEFSDGNITVKYVHLYPSLQNKKNENNLSSACPSVKPETSFYSEIESIEDNEILDDIDYYEHLTPKSKFKNIQGSTEKQKISTVKKESEAKASVGNCANENFAVCYICKTKPILGSLNFDKCIELGVPPGPLLGRLKKGEDVILENGSLIKSSDVKKPNLPGPIIIVVECPSEEYLDSLLNEPEFSCHQSIETPEEVPSVIVHFSSHLIVKNPKYKEWINRFPKETKHLFINEDNTCLGSINVNRLQYKLNMLHPNIFPLLSDHGIPFFLRKNESLQNDNNFGINTKHPIPEFIKKGYTEDVTEEDNHGLLEYTYYKCENNFISGKTLCQVNLASKKKYDYSYCLVLKKDLFLKEAFENEKFKNEFEKWNLELNQLNLSAQSCEKKYPKILFLGTGSSKPSKTRNSSGILVFLDAEKTILLDCGEGTYTQLVRFFGKDKARTLLKNLCAIYISHLHVDHHLGLITLLRERKYALKELSCDSRKCENQISSVDIALNPLYVFAPIQLSRWLNLYNFEFDKISDLYMLIANSTLSDHSPTDKAQNKFLELLNLKEFKTAYVHHCPNAFGVAITHKEGWKLTYSGDTRPCQNLVDLGKNSDILIHEATMDHTLKKEAVKKLHSTTEEAINIGKKMKAKFIILTHFSQRYCYIPLLCKSFTDEVGFAFDNMMVSYNELPLLSKLKDPLKEMFSKYYDLLEERVEHTRLRQDLKRRSSQSPDLQKKIQYIS